MQISVYKLRIRFFWIKPVVVILYVDGKCVNLIVWSLKVNVYHLIKWNVKLHYDGVAFLIWVIFNIFSNSYIITMIKIWPKWQCTMTKMPFLMSLSFSLEKSFSLYYSIMYIPTESSIRIRSMVLWCLAFNLLGGREGREAIKLITMKAIIMRLVIIESIEILRRTNDTCNDTYRTSFQKFCAPPFL